MAASAASGGGDSNSGDGGGGGGNSGIGGRTAVIFWMSGESAPAPVLPLRVASVVAAHAHAKYERARVPKSDAQAAPLISQRGCVISRRRPESPDQGTR